MKRLLCLIALTAAVATTARSADERVGLVLSGGGAKGIAHIGVIRALEENDIPIDYITGTSMGAIVGGLYAAGYSPDEMMELLASPTFTNAAAGTIDPSLRYYMTSPQPSPQIASFSLGNDAVARQVPWSLISPTVMNLSFMEVFAPASRACGNNFDRLFVPLRTISSNIKAQRGEVSRGGRLPDAIRASMSFPLVFCPIEIGDTLHYDGGIFDNFPVSTMRAEFRPDVMVGVDVHTPDSVPSPPNALNQLSDLVTRPQTYDMPEADGVKIHIDLHNFSLLDFAKARRIYDIGYRRGLEMIDSIKGRISARRPAAEVARRRAEFKRRLVPLRFSGVECTGGTPRQNEFIRSQFPAHEFSFDRAIDGFYKAISAGSLQDLQVYASEADSTTYTLHLRAFPKPAWALGIGGYISSSTSSMLYASVGYNAMSRRALSGNLGAWIGQSYMATQLYTTVRFGANTPYSLGLQGVVSKHMYSQTEQMFFKIDEPKFVTDFQAFGRAYLFQVACGRHAVASASVGYGYQRVKFADDEGVKIKNSLKLGQLALRFDYNTLDAIDFPTSGLEIHAAAMGLLGHRYGNVPSLSKKPYKWLQLRAKTRKYWNLNKRFALGLEGELLVSGRKAAAVYDAALAEAPSYSPTPSCFNSFNGSFRAYSFLGAGITPVWKMTSNLQLRGTFHIFAPWQRIERGPNNSTLLGKKPGSPEFFGELQAVFNLKLVSLCAYGNYRTGSVADRGWHAGISLGIFVLAPDFLK